MYTYSLWNIAIRIILALMKNASDLRIPFTWEDRHPVLLDRCLYIPSHYTKHEEWKIIPWEDPSVFGNKKPVVIEYCSGNGEWICSRAKMEPHLNWVAVEKRFDRSRKIWARLHREKIENLFVVCAEAFVFTKFYVPKRSVAKVFVNFPDPWPKLRHAKHRLIQGEFLQEMESVLMETSQVNFTTDDQVYADQMLEVVSLRPSWKFLEGVEDSSFGRSFFFDLWKSRGREIKYLHFEVGV